MPLEDCKHNDGTFAQPKLGKRGHVAAMTAIAIQVAKEEGWGILNMDDVVAQLPPQILFLPDGFSSSKLCRICRTEQTVELAGQPLK